MSKGSFYDNDQGLVDSVVVTNAGIGANWIIVCRRWLQNKSLPCNDLGLRSFT